MRYLLAFLSLLMVAPAAAQTPCIFAPGDVQVPLQGCPSGPYTSPGFTLTPKPVDPPPATDAPTIASFSPLSAPHIAPVPFTITLKGTNYGSTSYVSWLGNAITPTIVSATELRFSVGSLGRPGNKAIYVYTKLPGGVILRSNTVQFVVTDGTPPDPPDPPTPPSGAGTYNGGYSKVSRFYERMNAVVATAASAGVPARVFQYGQSYAALNGPVVACGEVITGFPLLALEIGPETAPTVVVVGAIHARELQGSEYAMRFGEFVVTDAVLRSTKRHILVVVASPDTLELVSRGVPPFLQRKNLRLPVNNPCPITRGNEGTAGQGGTDPDRNFASTGWGNITEFASADPINIYYRGTAAGSEPETAFLMAYMRQVNPRISTNLHSYGKAMGLSPASNATGVAMAKILGYTTSTNNDVKFPGQFQSWMFQTFGIPSFLIEMGTEFQPPYASLDLEWPKVKDALVLASKAAK